MSLIGPSGFVRIVGPSAAWEDAAMTTEAEARSAAAARGTRPPVRRSRRNRLVGGVAAGISDHLGVPPAAVRLAFVLLAFAGGFAVVVYVLLWLLAPLEAPNDETPPGTPLRISGQALLGTLLLVVGVIVVLWIFGLWFGTGLAWPAVLVAIGFAVIWARGEDRARWDLATFGTPLEAVMAGRVSTGRVIGGGALVLVGIGILLATTTSLEAATSVVVAVVVSVGGAALLAGPWIWNAGRQLMEERSSRIRSDARAEMAAHLHDSVLQTLALIQRAREPREMASLARTQERELRAWLYGTAPATSGARLRDAVDAMAGRIERRHHVRVDAVVVGDAPLDERLRALVAAASEAALNSANHSGSETVSVYVEVEGDGVTAFVRDQGRGFDASAATADRRGIAESIVARMKRHGGSADVVSRPGEGTEVRLHLPRLAG